MGDFQAFRVHRDGDGFRRAVETQAVADLPDGDVLIAVRWSSLNYKDALSTTGNPGVTRNFPHTPGIDAAGTVLEAGAGAGVAVGDEVLVIGYDLGMGTPGGWGQRIRVPAGWVIPKPAGMDLRTAMLWGTAGFTAALSVDKLRRMGLAPGAGPVLVTGATGGVGSVAVMLLAKLGYEVAAVSGKADRAAWLSELGAAEVLGRDVLAADAKRPLDRERWAGAVDTVGGDMLGQLVKQLSYGASVAVTGLVGSPALPATVLPFILRSVNVLGIDSVELPIAEKRAIWQRMGDDWALPAIDGLAHPLGLDDLSDAVDTILAGGMVGRGLVDLGAS